jgi:hypothetical protein
MPQLAKEEERPAGTPSKSVHGGTSFQTRTATYRESLHDGLERGATHPPKGSFCPVFGTIRRHVPASAPTRIDQRRNGNVGAADHTRHHTPASGATYFAPALDTSSADSAAVSRPSRLNSRVLAAQPPVGEPAQRQRTREEDPHLGPLERPEATRRLVSDDCVEGRSEPCDARLEL